MKRFEYFKVNTIEQAVSLLNRYGDRAKLLAGGSDLLGLMKDETEGPKLKAPEYILDLKPIATMNYLKSEKNGLRIGALTTLAELETSPLIQEKLPLLGQVAHQVGVPQIRNVGTVGGNLCQRPRCWYFRGKSFTDCLRKGGGTCYAVEGENKYHCILGGGPCFIVHPSDLALALIALKAKVKIAGSKGEKTIPLEKFFLAPSQDTLRENILKKGEILTEVEVPYPPSGSKGVYLKFKERAAFDFSLVSVAAVVSKDKGICQEARIVLGGVAPFPWRAVKAEQILKGKRVEGVIKEVARAAVEGAKPLKQNGYKIEIAKNLVEQALSSL